MSNPAPPPRIPARMLEQSRLTWLGITDDEMRKLWSTLRNVAVPLNWRAEFSIEWNRRGLK